MVLVSLWLGAMGVNVKGSLRRYFWGDESFTSSNLATLFLSTSFSFNGILYQTWLGYSVGWSALLVQVVWCASYFWLAKYRNRLTELSHGGTMHGVIGGAFGRAAERLAAIASIIGFTLLIGWELSCGVSLFELVAPEKSAYIKFLTVLLALVAAIYSIQGGMRGNLRANQFQNGYAIIAMLIAVSILGFSIFSATGAGYHSPGAFKSLGLLYTSLGFGGLITNLAFSLCWQFVDMSNWQNIASGNKDPNTTKQGLWRGAVWVFFFPGVIGTLAGMFMAGFKDITADNIVARMVASFANMNWPFSVLLIAGFVAAMLSTLDGYLLAAGQAFTWDLSKRRAVREVLAVAEDSKTPDVVRREKAVIASSQLTILAVAVAGSIGVLSLVHFDIINRFNLVYVVTVAQLALMPAVYSVLRGKTDGSGFLSILAGLIFGLGSVVIALRTHNESLLNWSGVVGLAAACGGIFVQRRVRPQQ